MRVARFPVFGVVEQRNAGQGKIAAPAGKFLERPATTGSPRRQPHFDDQLVRLERRRERAGKEISSLDDARPCLPVTTILASQVMAMPGISAAGSAWARAAADGAAVADLVVRDMANCFYEERMRAMQFLVAFDIAPARERAHEFNSAGIDCNAPQFGNAADVNEKARRRQSKGEHRNEALSAGDHFGFITVLGQECDRAFQPVGADILETCSLHCGGPGPGRVVSLQTIR